MPRGDSSAGLDDTAHWWTSRCSRRRNCHLLVSDFERRLDAMVSFAERAQGLADPDPSAGQRFRLRAQPLLPAFRDDPCLSAQAFAREFLDARSRENSDPDGTLARYRSLLDRQPGFAELHFRLARLLARLGSWEEAYRHAIAARDLDGLPHRCLTVFQDAVSQGRRPPPLHADRWTGVFSQDRRPWPARRSSFSRRTSPFAAGADCAGAGRAPGDPRSQGRSAGRTRSPLP